jgi:peptidoglycan/LPS O-acetylase OafA/YrhL
MDHFNFEILGKIKIPFPGCIFFNGEVGVNIFFVISGFLITKLLIQEEAINGQISLKNFYIRRICRIFPAYYFLLLVYFVLQLFSILYFTKASWLSSIFYYKYVNGTGGDWESSHFWSLSVEEQFYLIWPFLFAFCRKYRTRFAFVIIVLVMIFRLNAYYKFWHIPLFDLDNTIFQRADALMIGCIFALYEEKISNRLFKFINNPITPFALLFLIAFLIAGFLNSWNINYHLRLGFLLIPLGIAEGRAGLLVNILIVLLVLVSIKSNGAWFKFLNFKWMNHIGKLSYSLYLWQQMFIADKLGIFNKFPVNIICIFITASFSYYIIEKPFLKLKGAFDSGRMRTG